MYHFFKIKLIILSNHITIIPAVRQLTHGVEMDSTEMCLALIAVVGNLKPKTK